MRAVSKRHIEMAEIFVQIIVFFVQIEYTIIINGREMVIWLVLLQISAFVWILN